MVHTPPRYDLEWARAQLPAMIEREKAEGRYPAPITDPDQIAEVTQMLLLGKRRLQAETAEETQ